MKKSLPIMLLFAIIILFFIQSAGTLVESIYILDLMNSSLDENALGVLFFFTPVLLIPFHRKFPRGLVWISFAILFVSRGILPYLKTAPQVLAAGLGTFASLSLILLLLRAKPKGETHSQTGLWGSGGLALATGLSVFLRALEYGLDYSLTRAGGWAGWGLALCLGWLIMQLDITGDATPSEKKPAGVTASLLGVLPAPGTGLVRLFCSLRYRPLDGRELHPDRAHHQPAYPGLGGSLVDPSELPRAGDPVWSPVLEHRLRP